MDDLNNLMKEITKRCYTNMGKGFQIDGKQIGGSKNYVARKKFLSYYWECHSVVNNDDKIAEYKKSLKKLPKGITFETSVEVNDERKSKPLREFSSAFEHTETRFVIKVSDEYSSSVYQPGVKVILLSDVKKKTYTNAMEFKEKIKFKYPDLVQKLASQCRHKFLTYNGLKDPEYGGYQFSEAGLKPLSSMDDLLGVAFAVAEASIMNNNNNEIAFLEIREKEKYIDEHISFDFRKVTPPVTLSDW